MKKLKVVNVNSEYIEFEKNVMLMSEHYQYCCENHYLSFNDLTLKDFEGLEFDLTGDRFYRKIDGYGIELIPFRGHPIPIPGYGENNGYYSDNLSIILKDKEKIIREIDISECQEMVIRCRK